MKSSDPGNYSVCDNPSCYGYEMRGHVLRCDRCGRTTVMYRNKAEDAARRAVRLARAKAVA